MIRHKVTKQELLQKIEAVSPGWLARAKKKTKAFKTKGGYLKHKPFWSKIKSVYMDIQHNKCAYCDRRLEGKAIGAIEWDLEHFRPKEKTVDYQQTGINFKMGQGRKEGYYLLAYNPLNYLASCKPCNSALKKCYFPIEGPRAAANEDDFQKLKSEKPLFLYPLGKIDDHPKRLLTYIGPLAIAKEKSGRRNRRAQVILKAFDLNRELLQQFRCEKIETLWYALTNTADQAAAQRTIKDLCLPKEPFSACSTAFVHLYNRDQNAAKSIFNSALRQLGR